MMYIIATEIAGILIGMAAWAMVEAMEDAENNK